jgi:uncharacterized membrane protein (UPF0182 family)
MKTIIIVLLLIVAALFLLTIQLSSLRTAAIGFGISTLLVVALNALFYWITGSFKLKNLIDQN